jgi:5-methylcytosine-specific restriction protein A
MWRMIKMKKTTGKILNKKWKINVNHALYHKDGTWYHLLKSFLGVLFDKGGYVIFKTEEEYIKTFNGKIDEKNNMLSVFGGISQMSEYIQFSG